MLAIVVTLALVGPGCGDDNDGSSSGDTLTVKVAGIPPFSVTAWPLVVADSEGYFDDEGIRVDKIFTFDGGQLLAGDQVDVLNDGADSGLLAAEQGKDAIAIAPLASRVTDGLIVRDDIADLASLAGTTLRTSGPGATDEFLLKRFLEDHGVDPDDVEYLPVEDDGASLAQLDAGQIDGGLFDQGLLLQAERGDIEGVTVLVEPADLGVYPWNLLQTTRTFAEAHEDTIVGFVRAILRAIDFIRDPENKDAVVDAVVASDESLDRDDIIDTYDAAKGFGLFATEPLTPDDIQPGIDFIESGQEEPVSIDLDQFIENEYFTRAQGAQ